MLAYLFWHTPSANTRLDEYERDLIAFYDALNKVECRGLHSAGTCRISSVPWLNGAGGYEDFSLIEHSGALEDLNTKAVSDRMTAHHAPLARAMGIGHGGVYYHRSGTLEPGQATTADWLTRPRGINADPILRNIAQGAGSAVSIWRRFMVLGPAPEFLVLGNRTPALELPSGWQGFTVQRSPLVPARSNS